MITETIEIEAREPLFPLGGVTFSGPTVSINEELFTRPIVPKFAFWRNQHPPWRRSSPVLLPTCRSRAFDRIRVRGLPMGAKTPRSVPPTLRRGDEEVAESLNPRDILELLGIDEEAVHLRHVGLRQQADEPRVRLHAIVGQYRDADPMLDRMGHRGKIVDSDLRRARSLRVAPHAQKRV